MSEPPGRAQVQGQVAVCPGLWGVHAVPKLLTAAIVNCFIWEGLKIPEGSYTDEGQATSGRPGFIDQLS